MEFVDDNTYSNTMYTLNNKINTVIVLEQQYLNYVVDIFSTF